VCVGETQIAFTLRSFEMARKYRASSGGPAGLLRVSGIWPERPRQGERIRERIYKMLHLAASIEDALSAPVASFAWPFGRPDCRIPGPVWVALADACSGHLGIIMPPQ